MPSKPVNLPKDYPEVWSEWDPEQSVNPESVGSSKTCAWICPQGHSYDMIVGLRINRGLGCPYCSGRRVLTGFNDVATTDPDILPLLHPNNMLDPSKVSRGNRSQRFLLQCAQGHEYSQTPKALILLGRRCPLCSKHKKVAGINDLKSVHPEIAEEYAPENPWPVETIWASPLPEYRTQVEWVCRKNSNHRWQYSLHQRIATKMIDACPYCRGIKADPGKTDAASLFLHLAAEWSTKNSHPLSNYLPSSCVRGNWVCEQGHEWESLIFHRTINQSRCPQCYPQSSQGEDEIADFIQTHLPSGSVMVRHDRKLLSGKELDIFLPDFNVAIEYNGLYWHSEAAGKTKWYHYNKWRECRKTGIQLLQIWEDDWQQHPEIVKQMILMKLGLSSLPKTGARKCHVETINSSMAKEFCNSHHIQGGVGAKHNLGLFTDEELVAVMLLSPRQGKQGTVVLHRFCTSRIIPGGFSKLLHAFLELNPDVSIVETFSDNEISDGKLYTMTGFVVEKELPPDYCYVYGNIRYHKFNFRKKRFQHDSMLLWQEGLTESELAELNGLSKVWDSGKVKHVYTRFHQNML